MSNGNELLDKADALLSKYRSSSNHQENPTPDFPVLTEVVETVAEPLSIPATGDGLSETNLIELPESALDRELKQLTDELRQKVLLSVEPNVESFLAELLEMRIKNRLSLSLDRLANEIADAVKEETIKLVQKAVDQAVQREIAELQARIKG